jgi:hypothetical protein
MGDETYDELDLGPPPHWEEEWDEDGGYAHATADEEVPDDEPEISPTTSLTRTAGTALCRRLRRYAPHVWRHLGFVPSFAAGVGLVSTFGATVLQAAHPYELGFRCSGWALVLGVGVGLLVHAKTAFARALRAA